jgi:hypothetical protein
MNGTSDIRELTAYELDDVAGGFGSNFDTAQGIIWGILGGGVAFAALNGLLEWIFD